MKAAALHAWRGPQEEMQRTEKGMAGRERSTSRELTEEEQLFSVLVRLRLGLHIDDLSARCGISAAHFSRLFTTWIVFLEKELKLLFPFPTQEAVAKYSPPQFSTYPNTRVIIDCTELFIERPSQLKVNCQTYSSYKSHSTFKALVAVSPGGVVVFVSRLWSGRSSDKQITQSCGLLDLLEKGDNGMADKGFEIADLLAPQGVTLNIPPHLGNWQQFSPAEVDDTRKVAALRIHVERAIGRIQHYSILDGIMPLGCARLHRPLFMRFFFAHSAWFALS